MTRQTLQAHRTMAQDEWLARQAAHECLVDTWTSPHLARRSRGEKHPVEDFLFDYYPIRPGRLRRWHPGAGVLLQGEAADAFLAGPSYARDADGVRLDEQDWRATHAAELDRITVLLARTAGRPVHLGCFGMHEWAMVHGAAQSEVRHATTPLRLSPSRTAQVVADLGLRCTHFDAFRFFTDSARPLNLLQPTRQSQPDDEQPGCLHANMDLYRWAFALQPLVPSELVTGAFALAREIRVLDMRASPYDLRALGYEPVPVETAQGRAEYAAAQRGFAERAADLRAELLRRCAGEGRS
jgi:hypothetical protein